MKRSRPAPAYAARLGLVAFHVLLAACAGTAGQAEPSRVNAAPQASEPSAESAVLAAQVRQQAEEIAALRDSLERARAEAAPAEPANADGGAIAAVLASLGADVRRYNEHITTLANPYFEGRAPGTDGGKRATEYIEWQFRQLGLAPAFSDQATAADGTVVLTPNATYRQPVPFGEQTKIKRGAVSVEGAPDEFIPETDFTIMATSANAEATAPVAFAGYSIAEGPDGYSSFEGDDALAGKIAIVLRFEPMNDDGRSKWASSGWSPEAGLAAKLRAAARQGAVGIIFINPPGAADPRISRLMKIEDSDTGARLDIPVVMMSIEAGDRLVRRLDAEGRSLLDLRRLADEKGGVIPLGEAPVSIAAELDRGPLDTVNVGAVLPGRGDLADEFIVVGAHYDHVGFGYTGTSSPGRLHPGADDNASGTSGMLLAAEKLSKAYADIADDANIRSIIFLAFTAEEAGLVGSRHYVRNPSVPAENIKFMLNMDMIGRLRDRSLELGGSDTAAGLDDWLKAYIEPTGFEIKPSSVGNGRSDHASFISGRIPSLFFFTGLHREYHTPDDFAHLINREGAVEVVDLVTSIALGVAQRTEGWEFQRAGGRRPARPAPAAEEPAAEEPAAPPPPAEEEPRQFTVRVRFGIMPGDYSEATRGVLIGDVTPGSSAEEAGLKAGDTMVSWNGEAITSVESWMPLLAAHNPGDKVEIVYLRNGEEHRTTCTLKGR